MNDTIRRIPAVEVFFKNGGTFVVLRPMSDALDAERLTLSLEARRKFVSIREAATDEGVDLVLIPSKDTPASELVADRRWPRPIYVEKLALPVSGTSDGNTLNAVRAKLGSAQVSEYMHDRAAKKVLFNWARTAAQAIVDVLKTRRIYAGRVVICGGEPFIHFLAGHIVLNSPVISRYWVSGMFNASPYQGEGFIVNLTDTGQPQIKPLLIPTQATIFAVRPVPYKPPSYFAAAPLQNTNLLAFLPPVKK